MQPDTQFDVNLMDGKGKLIFDQRGKPVQIVQDLISGDWFAKIGDSMPYKGEKANLPALTKAGVVFVPHRNEKFRGLWAPIDLDKAAASAQAPSVQSASTWPQQNKPPAPPIQKTGTEDGAS